MCLERILPFAFSGAQPKLPRKSKELFPSGSLTRTVPTEVLSILTALMILVYIIQFLWFILYCDWWTYASVLYIKSWMFDVNLMMFFMPFSFSFLVSFPFSFVMTLTLSFISVFIMLLICFRINLRYYWIMITCTAGCFRKISIYVH